MIMSLRMLAAGFVTALLLALSTPTVAADLYDPYAPKYSGSPYDDPRYAELYGKPKPYHRPYAEEPVEDLYEDPDDDDLEPFDPGPPKRYAKPFEEFDEWSDRPRWRKKPDFEPYHPKKTYLPPADCLSRHELRRELVRDGWSDFRDLEIRGKTAFVTARRPNGTLYRLEVDRCAGEVVSANRLDGHWDSYAWRRRDDFPTY
jgi:hypothetical protein